MLNNVSSSVFTGSDSITLTPVVSAEWNHNLFNPPYITTAGTGTALNKSLTSGTVSNVTSGAKPGFTTKSFQMSDGTGSVAYTVSPGTSPAYKVITYIKTNKPVPVMVTLSGRASNSKYGSSQAEADSLGWTKVITYVGSSTATDAITSFIYTITANTLSGDDIDELNPHIVYFTEPQIYATTYFDYQNHSLFPTEMPFTYFRPGESYVQTGDQKYSFPSNYRKIASKILNNETLTGSFYGNKYMPISPIIQNPQFFLAAPPIPVIKNALATDISPYKYFVSDVNSRSITAIYEKSITTNKIVLKFNTLMTVPTVNISINGTMITVDGLQNITLPEFTEGKSTGILTLYWNGTAWTKKKWGDPTASPITTMPQFNSAGTLSLSTTMNKITVTQVSKEIDPDVEAMSIIFDPDTYIGSDLERMHVIEISPRLEIDLTDFVQNVSINKSLDSSTTALPISSLNTNDAQISLSGIPAMNGSTIVPVFSSQSNQSSTILANMLRKNIKFYINFNLANYSSPGSTTVSNTYIPGGVFYSDSWNENDIKDISIQCFDVSRYIQSTPVPDYVANLKSVFDIITNILDLAGFTDYDYDSLHSICNSKSAPLDMSYYYANSKDSTILDALNQIFVAYQIGAYIDEYGIMKFLSLQNILSSSTSNIDLSEANIVEGGFAISNAAKPGKVSLRYQTPKVKQSPALQNVTNLDIKDSPSFVYTTSNDVVWSQQTNDSVGFNYIKDNMSATSNVLSINNNDLLDIFHTFNLNNDGYAFIENEIVSFTYKEYRISTIDDSKFVKVSVKNNLELSAEIDRFIKKYSISLLSSYAPITYASGDGTSVTYTANNNFKAGQKISITGIDPHIYNIYGVVQIADATTFIVGGTAQGEYVSGGEAVIAADYDIKITPTGNITNVQRGMFGTSPSAHSRITDLASKSLSKKLFDINTGTISDGVVTAIVNDHDDDYSLPSIDKIKVVDDQGKRALIFPTSEVDEGYFTYSVKFELLNQDTSAAGLFFNMESTTTPGNMYILELVKLNTTNPKIPTEPYSPPRYRYLLILSSIDGSVTYWSDVTGECNSIISNFSKIIKKTEVDGKNQYSFVTDNAFNLKLTYVLSDGSDGENATEEDPKNIVSVFLNNVEITGWQEEQPNNYDEETNPDGGQWKPMEINRLTGARQKPYLPDNMLFGSKFGFCTTRTPIAINTNPEITYWGNTVDSPGILREIHATQKALLERSVSYFYQDREFLNGMVQNQPLYNNSPTYIMQTTPEISGINYYDVQYTTPAAVSVDILPIEYMMKYYPGNSPEDQTKFQKKLVDEYSLSYSTPLNTGFRARMAIANGRPHMVILKKDSDELNDLTNNFNLWTHEIVAPSDPEIIEQVIDQSNMSEVIQLDSEWIQSKQAAYKMLKIVQMGIEGFSKSVSLKIFGNPLIQVGDIVNLSYSLNGISQQRYLVHSVSHSFGQGLETNLGMKRIQE